MNERPVLLTGKHYKVTSCEGEVSIAYFYYNPDAECNGFGFNIADGGGFVPLSDFREDSLIEELELHVVNSGDVS